MKYSKAEPNNGRLQSVDIYEGETIEKKVARITLTNEPITDTAPIIYTEKKAGVLPAYNIRADRFDLAIGLLLLKAIFHSIVLNRLSK